VKHLKPLILSSAVAFAGLAALAAPAMAADTTASTSSRSCHWDRTTGRMICHRVRSSGTTAPPPPTTKPQQAGSPDLGK
jgi:hypothetical protein